MHYPKDSRRNIGRRLTALAARWPISAALLVGPWPRSSPCRRRLSHPSSQDISYRTPDNLEYRAGTATFEVDYEIQYDGTNNVTITVPAGQLTKSFDITLIDDDLEEPDETVELVG